MKSTLLYCLVLFTMLYSLPAQTIIYEKDYPNIPSDIEDTIIWGCNVDNNGNIQILGFSQLADEAYVPHNYIRIFDKDLNLLNHLYIDTNKLSNQTGFLPKSWRFTTTADGNHYFYALKSIFTGFSSWPGITSKEITKDWQITKDTLMITRTDSFNINTALFTADTNMVNFGFSNLDSIKHHIMVKKTNKDYETIWTKYIKTIDTSFIDIQSAYSLFAKDSSMIFIYRPFYDDPNSDKYLFYTCYSQFSKEGELLTHKYLNPSIAESDIAVDSDRIYTYYKLDSITYKFECWDLELNNLWTKEISMPEYYDIFLNEYPIVNINGEIVITGLTLKDSSSKSRPFILKYDSLGNQLWKKHLEYADTTRNCVIEHLSYDGKGTYVGIVRSMLPNLHDGKNGLWKVLKFAEDFAGIDDIEFYQELSCSPNPFSESTRVNFSLEHSSNVNIKVMNLMGETVFSTEYFAEAGSHHYDLNAATLPSGTYYIEINTPNNKYQAKAVLQK